MTAWLYEHAKKHMSKHSRVYNTYQLDIGAGAFKRAFVTHRKAVTTAVKRTTRMSEQMEGKKQRCCGKIWRETWCCVFTTASAGTDNLTLIPYLVVNKE